MVFRVVGNESVNDILLTFLSSESGVPLGDSMVFWILIGMLGILIFLALNMFTEFSKPVIIVLSLAPLLILDTIISFGTYTFEFPVIGDFEINRFVMIFGLIDFVFGCHLFDSAIPIIQSYAISTPHSSFFIYILTFLISVGDSLLQFVLFSIAAFYVISIIEYRVNREFEWQLPVSIVAGLIPVIAYAMFFSNPFEEFEKANIQVSNICNFFSEATTFELIHIIVLGLVSFGIVFMAISVIVHFLMSATIAIVPKMQMKLFETSYNSVAFLLTVLYVILYILHPDYQWYIILGVIIVWKGFRGYIGEISTSAKQKTVQRRIRNAQVEDFKAVIREEFHDNTEEPVSPLPDENKKGWFSLEKVVIIIGTVLILVGILLYTGVI